MSDPRPGSAPPPSLVMVALRGRCPRCGQGKLFDGLLALRPRCPVCDLDFRGADAGDGAPVGVMFVLGPILVILAFWMEFRFDPPIWVYAVVLIGVSLPVAVLLIRLIKASLLGIQYRYRASEMER